jgi:alanyl-tRNA synthetase
VTERIYYVDSAARTFTARVESVTQTDGRTLVRLDRTAFYPTSGGQPFDTGTLGAARVVDVFDDTDGAGGDVIHAVEGRAPAAGETVDCAVDAARRFDHMQQHTGQHMLSAAFDTLFDTATVSFHMGAEVSTIDLAHPASAEQIAAAEREANRVVWEDRSVSVRFVTDADIPNLPLRKPPKVTGTIRLVDINGWDLSACGGTHVAATGAVGMIAVTSVEKFKGGSRVEFVCGSRALARFNEFRDVQADVSRALSTAGREIHGAVQRLLDEAKEQRRSAAAMQLELARYRAQELAAGAETVGRVRAVLQSIDADAGGLKAMASAITCQPGMAVVLVSTSLPALAVVARSADVDLRANELLAGLIAKFGGRGGGKPDLAQGGGLNAPSADVLAEAHRLIPR